MYVILLLYFWLNLGNNCQVNNFHYSLGIRKVKPLSEVGKQTEPARRMGQGALCFASWLVAVALSNYEVRLWTKCLSRRFMKSFCRFVVSLCYFLASFRRPFCNFVVSSPRFVVSLFRFVTLLVTSTFQARGLVSKETVVLRRWGRETQNFGFIN